MTVHWNILKAAVEMGRLAVDKNRALLKYSRPRTLIERALKFIDAEDGMYPEGSCQELDEFFGKLSPKEFTLVCDCVETSNDEKNDSDYENHYHEILERHGADLLIDDMIRDLWETAVRPQILKQSTKKG